MFASIVCFARPADAQDCPNFFRFVEFGIQDQTGQHMRGGPVFRGESLEGRSLLNIEQTKCRQVRDIASDGHGNPIPVVSHVSYDVAKTGLDVTSLQVSYDKNIRASAGKAAARHRQSLARGTTIRGQYSLCSVLGEALSCQVVSPYLQDIDLVITCDATICQMPVLAVAETIQISAQWRAGSELWAAPDKAGDALSEKLRAISAFFEPLTSGL